MAVDGAKPVCLTNLGGRPFSRSRCVSADTMTKSKQIEFAVLMYCRQRVSDSINCLIDKILITSSSHQYTQRLNEFHTKLSDIGVSFDPQKAGKPNRCRRTIPPFVFKHRHSFCRVFVTLFCFSFHFLLFCFI